MTDLKEPLLAAKPSLMERWGLKRGSVLGGTANLFSSTVGCGILGLPFALFQSGLVLGLAVLLASLAVMLLYSMIQCWGSDYTGEVTYVGIIAKLYGPTWRRITEVSIILYSLGALCSVQVLIGIMVVSLLKTAGWTTAEEHWALIVTAYNLLFLVLVVPEQLTALRFLSSFALLGAMYIALVVVCETPAYITNGNSVDIPMARISVELVDSFALLVFALDCSRAVGIVYSELQPRTSARMNMVLIGNYVLVGAIYASVAVCGLISQGKNTSELVIDRPTATGEPPEQDLPMVIARLAMVVVLLVAFPVHLSPLKLSMQQLLAGPQFTPNRVRYFTVTFGFLGFSYLFAVFINNAIAYFKVIGGVFTIFSCCVLPSLIYCKLAPRWKAGLLGVVTCIMSTIGIASAVKTLVDS